MSPETRTAKLNLHLRQAFPNLVIQHRLGTPEAIDPRCTLVSPDVSCAATGPRTRYWGQLKQQGQLCVTDIRSLIQTSCKACSFGQQHQKH